MEYRKLGKTGLKISELSYGSWVTFGNQLDVKKASELMAYCFDKGINFFDNAEAYKQGQSEVIMGEVIKKLNWTRYSFIVSSKVFWGGERPTQKGLSHKHIKDACENALSRLQVDYLDLFFCHRPDPDTPIEETVRAMHTLILQGKICYWGTSEWSAVQISDAFRISRELGFTPPTMEQPEYNMFARDRVEREYVSLFENELLGTTTWSPLASGLLTGKYNHGMPDDTRTSLPNYEFIRKRFESDDFKKRYETVKKLTELSAEVGISLAKLSICWCLRNKNISTVILGASKKSQLEENIDAINHKEKLSDEVQKKISTLLS
jgi:voltage-dependent potassium channel beta subunit